MVSFRTFSVMNDIPLVKGSKTPDQIQRFFPLTLTVLNFWKFTSYCSLKLLWSGMGEVVPARTSPTLHPASPPTVHQLSRLALRVNWRRSFCNCCSASCLVFGGHAHKCKCPKYSSLVSKFSVFIGHKDENDGAAYPLSCWSYNAWSWFLVPTEVFVLNFL